MRKSSEVQVLPGPPGSTRLQPVQRAIRCCAMRAERMKPDLYRVHEAVGILNADNAECTLVGDSTTDVLSGPLSGVTVIG
jgi:phosphoglycolate phosphatase-like HAD superfamily hydrolase